MKTKTLTVIYNMLSGHFPTKKSDILYCFSDKEHEEVLSAINSLREEQILYTYQVRDDYGQIKGVYHFINWTNFKEDMIDQSLVS